MRYGALINQRPYTTCETIGGLIAAIKRAGISGGLVYNYIADGMAACAGNDTLINDIRVAAETNPEIKLFGAYTILPSCTNESVPPNELPAYMKKNKLGAIRINPSAHRYLAKAYVLGDYLQTASDKKIPVMLDAGPIGYETGMSLDAADDYLNDFPELTAILYYDNVWPNDRFIRPMMKRYKNLYVNAAHFVVDGQFEETIGVFGDGRLLHGSSYPEMYMACGILPIKHAEIKVESKIKIAGGNFIGLMEGWRA